MYLSLSQRAGSQALKTLCKLEQIFHSLSLNGILLSSHIHRHDRLSLFPTNLFLVRLIFPENPRKLQNGLKKPILKYTKNIKMRERSGSKWLAIQQIYKKGK